MKTPLTITAYAALLLGFLPAGMQAQNSVPRSNGAEDVVAVASSMHPSKETTGGAQKDPQLKINPLKILERSEPPTGEPYQLGTGDTIKLYVAGHPELTRDYIIGPDGLVTIDLAGSVKVSDLTREQGAAAVRDALATYYVHPAVTIGVARYGSNTIMIFGNVLKPGILDYEGTTPTLLDAIGRAGMLANPSSKDGLPDTCIIYRGDNTVLPVPLHDLLYGQGISADVRLHRGDKIFIPVDRKQFVSVLGQVGKPGPVAIAPGLDLKLALAEAGGLRDEAGVNPTVHIFQAATNRELTIPYKRLMNQAAASEIPLGPGDVVSIPMSGFNQVGYVLTKISPALTMISLAALIAQ